MDRRTFAAALPALFACTGPMGPQGERGESGSSGQQGLPGKPFDGPWLAVYPGDDIAQIAADAAENTVLWIAPGEFYGDLVLKPGISVLGSGWNTVLYGSISTLEPFLQRTMFLRDLVLEGGITLRAFHVELDRVMVRNHPGTAFDITTGVGARISRCVTNDTGPGFLVRQGTDGRMVDCEVNVCTGDGVHIETAAGWGLRGVAVSSAGGSAFWLKGGLHTEVAGCEVDDYGLDGDTPAFGMNIDPIFSGEGKGCSVIGGHIHNRAPIVGTRRCFQATVANALDARLIVTGLTINANGEDGIRLASKGGHMDALIDATTVYGSSRPFSMTNTGIDVTFGTNVGLG